MSIVGPRPLRVYYLPWYTEEEKHRHDVRPGLTGWAQVNGRNNLDWDKRLALDRICATLHLHFFSPNHFINNTCIALNNLYNF